MTPPDHFATVRENVEELRTRIVQLGGEEDFSAPALAALAEIEKERAPIPYLLAAARENERRRIVAMLEGMRDEWKSDAVYSNFVDAFLKVALSRITGGDDA